MQRLAKWLAVSMHGTLLFLAVVPGSYAADDKKGKVEEVEERERRKKGELIDGVRPATGKRNPHVAEKDKLKDVIEEGVINPCYSLTPPTWCPKNDPG